jgi:hypothetical protein
MFFDTIQKTLKITSTDARKKTTQNEDKQNKEHNTENFKDYQYRCQKKENTE